MSNRSVRRTLGSMVLAFESFVVFFGTLAAFGLDGSALQLVLLVVSFFVPWMLLISIIFVGFWCWAMIAGYTIDLAKKNRAGENVFKIEIEKDNK